jgi:hypothetical protein
MSWEAAVTRARDLNELGGGRGGGDLNELGMS